MNKKLISLLLSAALAVSMLTVPAFAAEGGEADAALDETNEVVVTLGDTVTASTVEDTDKAAADKTAADKTAADKTKTADSAPAASTEKKQITYVALGDSIVAGVGLADVKYAKDSTTLYSVDMSPNFKGYSPDCYVGKVATMMGLDRDHAINLGLPALTAPDLADMVRDGQMHKMNMESGCWYKYPEFQDYIRKADVVSVQIGSNDAFVPCIVALGNATNWKSEALAASVLAGDLRASGSPAAALIQGIKDMHLTRDERNATWNLLTSEMGKICDRIYPQTTAGLISVVQEIRKLNPDCQILLMGYTDPVPFVPCWHNYFKKLNKFEKQLAETYDLTYVAIPKAKTDLDVHPTISGHEYIAKKIVNSIELAEDSAQ